MKKGDIVVIIAHRGDRRLHSASVDFGQIGKVILVYDDPKKVEIRFSHPKCSDYSQTVDISTVARIKDLSELEKVIYARL